MTKIEKAGQMNKVLAHALRQYQQEQGLTKVQMAKKLQVTERSIYDLRAEKCGFSVSTAFRLISICPPAEQEELLQTLLEIACDG